MLKPNSLLPDTQHSDPQDQFKLLELMGRGAYGQVYKAMNKKNGSLYAIKIISATSLSQISSIKKQIQVLKLCNNEHIVKYYGSYLKDSKLWIVLEYCHAGSIIDLLNITQKKLNEYQIASILENVLEGLVYLHQNKKIHRDIKAANILLNNEGIAKLADFGVAAQSISTNAGHRSQVGSPYWMSPEVMKNNEYTNKTDIWSLGVTAIEIAQGIVPNFHIKRLVAIFQLKDKPIQQLKQPQKWSIEFNSFIKECLQINHLKRPEAKTLLKHEFIVKKSKGKNLLAQLVQNSLPDIEQFRRNQQQYEDSEEDFMNMLNTSSIDQQIKGTNQLNPTENGKDDDTQRGGLFFHQQHNNLESSMIVKHDEINQSMIVKENQISKIIVKQKQKEKKSSINFLNDYIKELKNGESQINQQREQLKRKVLKYDEICLKQMEKIFMKYKEIINKILVEGINDHFFGMDQAYIKKQFTSKLLISENIKQFIVNFPIYKDIQIKSEIKLPKNTQNLQIIHLNTQINNLVDSKDIFQLKQANSRNFKSQQFISKPSKTPERHGFNSNSIISDIENVKYKNQAFNKPTNKRFVATEPPEWIPDSIPFQIEKDLIITDKDKLKLFFLDPDVKQSLLIHMKGASNCHQMIGEPNTIKYNRVKKKLSDEHSLKHQNSVTIIQGKNMNQNHFSEQEFLLLNEQLQEDESQIDINLFNIKDNLAKDANKTRKKEKKVKMEKNKPHISQKRIDNNLKCQYSSFGGKNKAGVAM